MANLLVERHYAARLVLATATGDPTLGLGAQGGDLIGATPPRFDEVIAAALTPHHPPPTVTFTG